MRKLLAALLVVTMFVSTFNFSLGGKVEASVGPAQYYDVWWDFEDQIWDEAPAGTSVSGSANGSMALTHETEDDGNKYMKAEGKQASAWRAAMYRLSDEEVRGAEVVFDLMPIRTNGDNRYGDVMFFSSADNYSYFNITFNQNLQIFYYHTPGVNYTADPYMGIDMNGNALSDGSHAYRVSQLQDTGLQGDGSTWFEVKVVFDYANSFANLTIANKSNPAQSFTTSGIPIREAAVNVNRFLLTAFKGLPEFGFDNFGVKYLTEVDPSSYYTTYWNDFESMIWDNKAIGTAIIAEGGSSGATLTSVTESAYGEENRYMHVNAASNGSFRVSRLDLPNEALSGADVTFDWKPVSAQNVISRFGDVAFISSGSTYPYFGLQFNKDREITYYTIGENIAAGWGVTYSEEALEGGFARNNEHDATRAANTGITADGETWYSVKLSFDYENHYANMAITERDNPDNVLYAAANIPIYASAINPAIVAAGGWKGMILMGLDNFGVRYKYSDATSIVSVRQPENVMVVAPEWEQHVHSRPTAAIATMGDGSIREFEIAEWSSEPAFDESVYTTYTWTAPLIIPEGIRNHRNLSLTYRVDYVSGYFATGAYDPTTLELAFGSVTSVDELLELLPKQTHAVLNNGQVVKMDIDPETWEATYTTLQDQQYLGGHIPVKFDSPEFDPDQEGIYVYKAKLKSTGSYEVNNDIWVEARVNYFAYDNHYNGFERSIENLDRGLYAIKNTVYDTESKTYVDSSQGGIFLSWRILAHEYAKVSKSKHIVFDIYRNGTLIHTVENETNYLDVNGKVGDNYMIKTTQDGESSFGLEAVALEENYLSIPLQRPLPSYSATGNFAIYRLNDLGVADVDGDGVYEIVVKWYPNNGFDPGVSGTNRMSSPHIIDVYKLDGTALWRLNMGYSSPAGQHFDNFMFYDLDQDGKAELSLLTQDGTRTYRPDENGKFKYVTTDAGGHVYRSDNPNDSESTGKYVPSDDGNGYVLSNAEGYNFAYVGEYGSPVMDDAYLIDVVGDIDLEGVGMLSDGFKGLEVNEYFTVFNGATGEIIDTVDYIYNSADVVGTEGFNKGNRYNIAIAYIPSDLEVPGAAPIPAVLANRAYYSRTTVAAYTLVDGKIQLAWHIDTVNEVKGGGNHNMVTGDMDNDGYDELYLGGTAIDHDGTILWAKDGDYNRDFMKHGDMIHMSAVFPDSDQLYVFTPVEDGSVSTVLNYALTNAATGARIVGHTFGRRDTGRGMLANVTPNPGYELWASTLSGIVDGRISNVLFNAYGEVVTHNGNVLKRPAVQTWSGYWDGDLLSELPDSSPIGGPDKSGFPMGVHKYNWETGETETIASFSGTLTNNSTKNNPGLMADILGDWREEILVRSADNEELRIYMTNIPTEYMIYTLMHDSVYRNAVANQNTTYNQPAHTGFYLGEDEMSRNRVLNFELPTYNYKYTTGINGPEEPGEPPVTGPFNPPPTDGGNKDPDDAGAEVEIGSNGVIAVHDEASGEGSPIMTVSLTEDMVNKALASSPDGKLRIRSVGAAVTIDGEWIIASKLEDGLAVEIDRKAVADLPPNLRIQTERNGVDYVFTINLTTDGQVVDSIPRGSVIAAIRYDREARANPYRIVVYELLEDGNQLPVSLSRYDTDKGQLIFQPNHLSSLYFVMESRIEFQDAGGWSREAVEALAARGIVKGKGEGLFDPQGTVTRAEFTAMLARMFGLQTTGGEAPFSDVPYDAWYRADLAAAHVLGIVNGRPDGTFGGNDTITREEMNVLLHRAAILLELLQAQSGGSGTAFSDESAIAAYARDAIRQLNEAGLVSGLPDGTFAPKKTATREQAATMLWRLLQRING